MNFLLFVRLMTSVSTLCLFSSPMPSILRIRREKNTGTTSVIPLVALFVCNFIWMQYGLVLGDLFPLFVTYFIGVLVAGLYIFVYLQNSSDKPFVVAVWVTGIVVGVLVGVFAVLGPLVMSAAAVSTTVGWIATASSIAMYGSPFATLRQVVVTWNPDYIPIHMVLGGIFCCSMWITYGALIHQFLVAFPCVVGACFGVLQVVTFVVYRFLLTPPSQSEVVPTEETPLTADSETATKLLSISISIPVAYEPTTMKLATDEKERVVVVDPPALAFV